jgi:predicted metal-binding transcription factor (methanogenesis marker protein 9)
VLSPQKRRVLSIACPTKPCRLLQACRAQVENSSEEYVRIYHQLLINVGKPNLSSHYQ